MSLRPRLDKDVIEMAAKNAAENGRSFPDEINYALRKFYTYQDNVKTMNKIVRAQSKSKSR